MFLQRKFPDLRYVKAINEVEAKTLLEGRATPHASARDKAISSVHLSVPTKIARSWRSTIMSTGVTVRCKHASFCLKALAKSATNCVFLFIGRGFRPCLVIPASIAHTGGQYVGKGHQIHKLIIIML